MRIAVGYTIIFTILMVLVVGIIVLVVGVVNSDASTIMGGVCLIVVSVGSQSIFHYFWPMPDGDA